MVLSVVTLRKKRKGIRKPITRKYSVGLLATAAPIPAHGMDTDGKQDKPVHWRAAWHEIGGKRSFYRSRWESNYAYYLEWLKGQGLIKEWEHEPVTFWFEKIKRGVRSYLIDFRVTENDGRQIYHEIKGWMDSRSKTKLKRMAKYYPEVKIIVIDSKGYAAIAAKVSRIVPGWDSPAREETKRRAA